MQVDAWSLLEVEMNENLRTFTVKRRLQKEQLGTPGLNPSFIFYAEGAQILVNDKGTFLIRWKKPKQFGGKLREFPFIPSGHEPKLKRLYSKSPFARLAKKSMKQLFFSSKSKVE
jgi:hypothetical protein